MKRNVKNILFAFAAAALSCAMASCSHSSDSDDEETPGPGNVTGGVERPSETITFSVTENSTNAENTVLMFKYDRSAAGAKEAVTIENCGIVVEINDTFVKMIDKLEFELDEYGAYFDGDKSENTRKEYKAKVSLYNKVQKGDNVVVYYNKGIGTITGEGKDAEAVKSLVVALIDTDEAVGYYKELADNKEEYQPLFNKEGSSNGDPVTPPAGDEGNTGTGNEDGKVALGLDAMDGWGKYEISDKSATGFTMKSTAAQKKNDCCGADITFGSATKVTFTVKNNATEECWVQVLVKKDGDSNSESGSRMTSATIDGVDAGDVTWGANTTINAKTSKNFVLNLTNTDADKFVFALNSNLEDNNKSSGNITVSEAYMYK
ncbi:MAG: hypothetical protein J6K96_05105 [Treponema sp.]|nr:hypothetical protein [Treponema sp.]